MIAMILAAGYATRLYPLTMNTPKALLDIGGRPMLDYLMDEIASVPEIRDVHLVTNGKFFGMFLDWLAAAGGRYVHLNIHIHDDGTTEESKKLGAVGDMAFTIDRAQIDDDLLVCASDNFFTFPLTDFVADFRWTGKDTLLMHHIGNIETLRGFAVATLDEENRVLDLVEKPKQPPTDIGVYALYLYRRDTLPLIHAYLAEGGRADSPGYFPEWLCKRRDVRGYLFDGECIDIGTPRMYAEVCARFEEGGDLYRG